MGPSSWGVEDYEKYERYIWELRRKLDELEASRDAAIVQRLKEQEKYDRLERFLMKQAPEVLTLYMLRKGGE